jgi:hypothetical protein
MERCRVANSEKNKKILDAWIVCSTIRAMSVINKRSDRLPARNSPMSDSALVLVYHHFRDQNNCFVDTIVADPVLRASFLEQARNRVGDIPEKDLLLRLRYLRKRGRLGPANPR